MTGLIVTITLLPTLALPLQLVAQGSDFASERLDETRSGPVKKRVAKNLPCD